MWPKTFNLNSTLLSGLRFCLTSTIPLLTTTSSSGTACAYLWTRKLLPAWPYSHCTTLVPCLLFLHEYQPLKSQLISFHFPEQHKNWKSWFSRLISSSLAEAIICLLPLPLPILLLLFGFLRCTSTLTILASTVHIAAAFYRIPTSALDPGSHHNHYPTSFSYRSSFCRPQSLSIFWDWPFTRAESFYCICPPEIDRNSPWMTLSSLVVFVYQPYLISELSFQLSTIPLVISVTPSKFLLLLLCCPPPPPPEGFRGSRHW